jgi:hypothetical protein
MSGMVKQLRRSYLPQRETTRARQKVRITGGTYTGRTGIVTGTYGPRAWMVLLDARPGKPATDAISALVEPAHVKAV